MFGKQGHSASAVMLPRGHFACSVGSGSRSTSVWLVGNGTNDSDEKIVTGSVVNHTQELILGGSPARHCKHFVSVMVVLDTAH